jgi:hypothetical protein
MKARELAGLVQHGVKLVGQAQMRVRMGQTHTDCQKSDQRSFEKNKRHLPPTIHESE